MKRFLIGMLILAIGGVLFAQASPFSFYGSARTGFFYGMETPEESYDTAGKVVSPDSRTYFKDDYLLQGNSRFGAKYQKDNLSGKVEFGTDSGVNLRLFYGKYNFEGWSILAGQDEDGTNMLSNQTYASDKGLNGYGAIFGGRNPQIKFGFMEDALYLALIKPNCDSLPTFNGYGGDRSDFDILIPKINFGYKWDINDDMSFHPTVMFQMITFNSDETIGAVDTETGFDETVMSYLIAFTYDMKIGDQMKLRLHGNYGSNAGNMGFKEPGISYTSKTTNGKVEVDKTHDVGTMGGYLTFNYDISDQFGIGVGAGYAQTSITDKKYKDKDNKDVDWSDDRMAFYLQLPYKTLGSFTITPEFGMFMEMADAADLDQGSSMYFGAQLKYDF